MITIIKNSDNTKKNAIWLVSSLILINITVWIIAVAAFYQHPEMLGMSLLAWSLGLRHAVDADHIAAIDTTTRKMMEQGKKPITIGTFFSLGHSTIVMLAAAAIALTVGTFKSKIPFISDIGGIIGTSVSILFLLIMAYINLRIFLSVYKKFNAYKQGIRPTDADLNIQLSGPLNKLFHFSFKFINKSWHMYFIGFLFGLGFDTATEITLLALSATNASQGMNIWLIMIFPILFTVGMSLIDTLDNLVMIGAYGWAFSKPSRKLYYNMTITGISVIVALIIGGLEALSAIASSFKLSGSFWDGINTMTDHFGMVGIGVIAIFVGCWVLSIINYKLRSYDKLDQPI
ncbi:nickel transporter [Photobacterium iliopiscarium]|uniref:HoxN/HupN/NixA family nickel/cobalt transporter n=1 Tax=Photobacterium iliopiscarium TaxID=56192 RepID=UPI0005D4001C|nr:HoxN/HupN/NixA family nickel/cobalt transporter [Photobacterium iliopiscarium]KJG13594.1 nickel transporter [Photobacterium iliopiscarium]KJG22309.1 nickel transporter [Photobacterium iliopiscarium]